MKKGFYLLVCFITMISCNNEFETDEVSEILSKNYSGRAASVHPVYNALGWGYDVTGNYMSYKSIKAPVIDVYKFDAEHTNDIIINNPYQRTEKVYYGSNSEEYIKSIGMNAKPNDTLKLSGTITFNFDRISYTSQYSWASLEKLNILRHIHIEQSNAELSRYLTNEFQRDLNTYTNDQIIQKYGTHILTDFSVGGKLSLLYRSMATDRQKEMTVKSGFEAALNHYSLSANYDINTTLINKNKEQYMICETIGGTGGIISKINLETGLPDLDINNWDKTVDMNTAGVIDINWERLIPIYELISDASKKNSLKKAVDAYIEESRLDMLTPLFRYFRNDWKDHLYTTDIAELGYDDKYFKYEGIECYVYSEKKNQTVPLYRYFSNGMKDHLYTTNVNELGFYDKNYAFEGIACYVFDKSLPETVPVRRYFIDSYKDHIYISGKLGDNPNGWRNEGIAFYAYLK